MHHSFMYVHLLQLIEMCSHVRTRWNYRKLIFPTEELDVLESSYNKYHTYLALALHNAVQNKDANYCKSEVLLTALYDTFHNDFKFATTILPIDK